MAAVSIYSHSPSSLYGGNVKIRLNKVKQKIYFEAAIP